MLIKKALQSKIKKKIYNVAKEQAISNSVQQNLIIAASSALSTYTVAQVAGLIDEEKKENVVVTLSIDKSSLNENLSTQITITATLAEAADSILSIDFSPTGSATEGTDYSTIDTISILPGFLTGTTTFTLTDDSIYEGDETIKLIVNKSSSLEILQSLTLHHLLFLKTRALQQ